MTKQAVVNEDGESTHIDVKLQLHWWQECGVHHMSAPAIKMWLPLKLGVPLFKDWHQFDCSIKHTKVILKFYSWGHCPLILHYCWLHKEPFSSGLKIRSGRFWRPMDNLQGFPSLQNDIYELQDVQGFQGQVGIALLIRLPLRVREKCIKPAITVATACTSAVLVGIQTCVANFSLGLVPAKTVVRVWLDTLVWTSIAHFFAKRFGLHVSAGTLPMTCTLGWPACSGLPCLATRERAVFEAANHIGTQVRATLGSLQRLQCETVICNW